MVYEKSKKSSASEGFESHWITCGIVYPVDGSQQWYKDRETKEHQEGYDPIQPFREGQLCKVWKYDRGSKALECQYQAKVL